MKVLITGGAGFLGHDLIDRLLDAGHDVVVIEREASGGGQDRYKLVGADITDIAALQACRKSHPDIDTIVHLAAVVPRVKSDDQPSPMYEVNVQGTCNLLEVFGPHLRNFVYASTAEVYGLPDTDQPIKEAMLPVPLSYYGASKLAGEYFCNVFSQRHNLPIAILRFTVLYGSGDRISRAIPNFIRKALKGESLEVFGGEELRDYLHVKDAAAALYLAATKPVGGTFNIGTGSGISIKETAETILTAVDPSLSIKILPREKKASDIVLNTQRATEALGFSPKYRFPDLLEEQVQWHKTN